jgi:methylenetetrahydrofolate reductase (NADPH)
MTSAPPRISFEFFPPKTEAMETALLNATRLLAPFQPRFVSVTYGASGSTRDRTHKIVERLHSEFGLNMAAHLTCVGATCQEIEAIATQYWQSGIRHLVALRGDPPETEGAYKPHPGGYAFASDLVKGLLHIAPFQISVAAYPETHPEALSPEADLENLKRKMQQGATQAITQFFLDTNAFLRFRDRARHAGITIPLIPGMLPVANFARACEFATRCGASVPAALVQRFEDCAAGSPEHQAAALSFANEQIAQLRREGVNDFHFYTLNRADLVAPICEYLQKEPHG